MDSSIKKKPKFNRYLSGEKFAGKDPGKKNAIE